MTPAQIELARHALGLKQQRLVKESFRNYFVAGKGHPDFEDWLALVATGDAVRREMAYFGGDDLFHLTRSGAEKALLPGESLDLNDFPGRLAA